MGVNVLGGIYNSYEPMLSLYAIHKPLPLGLRPRVSGLINPIQTLHMVYNYYLYHRKTRLNIAASGSLRSLNYPALLRARLIISSKFLVPVKNR